MYKSDSCVFNQTRLTSDLVVLEVLVTDEREDYIAFREEICRKWDCLHDAVCIHIYTSHSPSHFRNHRTPSHLHDA